MVKGATKLLALVGMILMASIVLVACGGNGNKSEVDFVLRFEDVNTVNVDADVTTIARSLTEWEALNLVIYDSTKILYREFNEQFFNDNSLLVFVFTMGQTGNEFVEVNLNRDGNRLAMEVFIIAGIADAISQGAVVVEVSNSDLVGITNFVAGASEVAPKVDNSNL